ncbi:phosphatidylserine decarboxylase [Nakamurella antarctica]|uniref:Phosphatidylserine decarboxylase proenzyme n=1 Tax=Nakamurella antarctica TaxID=1902245 RepID=A0A3G8ZIQ2_9ACTN|nr:phosphatidylserine decarboxylase [Nakamurella antarctica]AZI57239.1 phosphatidylserine decarboxylase [Nakamurella antarctica]
MADDHTPSSIAHIASLVRSSVPPMHPGGRPIVFGVAGATLLVRSLFRAVGLKTAGKVWTRLGLLATAGCAAFFRAPVRVTPQRPDLVFAAGDGVVSLIEDAVPPAELNLGAAPRPRVSIFLSVLDVHVQRIPISGTVTKAAYHPGKFLSADLDKASEDNERNSLLITTADGTEIVVVQIAGLLARRIVCDVHQGEKVRAGQMYGLIRFGSRVDTYLPVGAVPTVVIGQRTIGGETMLADLSQRAAATFTAL